MSNVRRRLVQALITLVLVSGLGVGAYFLARAVIAMHS